MQVVLSAYILQLKIVHLLVKSFMYIINNTCPKIDPCGQINFASDYKQQCLTRTILIYVIQLYNL